jgi:heme-degrading monooxygenase HmoA
MIARLWSAHTTPALSNSYLQHFEIAVQPQLQRVEGFLGATVSTRPAAGSVEILVTTYWTSFTAIDAALLTDFDQRVRHYEVAIAEFPAVSTRQD